MTLRLIHAEELPPGRGYSQAVEVAGAERTVYLSGQVGVGADGRAPEDIAEQARLVWRNLRAQLAAANMGVENLVKLTVVLTDRAYLQAHVAARAEALGTHAPASTLLIAGLADPAWKIEIEAVAQA